jgi:hypothetical protein
MSNENSTIGEVVKTIGWLVLAGALWTVENIVVPAIVEVVTGSGTSSNNSRGGSGGSVWTVGGGGKKPGSWSSGRHG